MAISIGIGNYIRSSLYRGTNGTPNPVFALNFDNFAYKAVDYPDFATGKVTTNKIVVNSTTATFNGWDSYVGEKVIFIWWKYDIQEVARLVVTINRMNS